MHTYELHIRLESQHESQHDRFSWRGSLSAFAKANSLTPGQMFELYSQLEGAGEATLSAYGESRYTLRREDAPRQYSVGDAHLTPS